MTLTLEEGVIPYATVTNNPTPDDLRRSNFPDTSLLSIVVKFEVIGAKTLIDSDSRKMHFQAHHVTGDNPYILLSGGPKYFQPEIKSPFDIWFLREYLVPYFGQTRGFIARAADGVPEGNILVRNEDICDVIKLKRQPTQAWVADLVEKYSTHFSNVRIDKVYLKNVPKKDYRNAGIPADKLILH